MKVQRLNSMDATWEDTDVDDSYIRIVLDSGRVFELRESGQSDPDGLLGVRSPNRAVFVTPRSGNDILVGEIDL